VFGCHLSGAKKHGKRQEKACLGEKFPRVLAHCLFGAKRIGRLADVPFEHSALTPGTIRLQNTCRSDFTSVRALALQICHGASAMAHATMSPHLQPLPAGQQAIPPSPYAPAIAPAPPDQLRPTLRRSDVSARDASGTSVTRSETTAHLRPRNVHGMCTPCLVRLAV